MTAMRTLSLSFLKSFEKGHDRIHILKEFFHYPGRIERGRVRLEAGSSAGNLLQGTRQERLAWTEVWRW